VNWATVVIHWLHVLFAVTWFGGHISRVVLVEPAVRTLPEAAQQQFNRYVEIWATRIFVPVIIGVGVTGILRGTVFGPIQSFEALFGTSYGLTFLAAIAFGLLAASQFKPSWFPYTDYIAFFGAFTAMILMHFGL
jgi:putative copper export protein